MGRSASGVKAITLSKGDEVIASDIIDNEGKILIVSEKGYGKCTENSEFRVQSRGGKGLKTYRITEKTGNVISMNMVRNDEELMIAADDGIIIRLRVKDISTTSRITSGVKLINVSENASVISTAKISGDCIENEQAQEENQEES